MPPRRAGLIRNGRNRVLRSRRLWSSRARPAVKITVAVCRGSAPDPVPGRAPSGARRQPVRRAGRARPWPAARHPAVRIIPPCARPGVLGKPRSQVVPCGHGLPGRVGTPQAASPPGSAGPAPPGQCGGRAPPGPRTPAPPDPPRVVAGQARPPRTPARPCRAALLVTFMVSSLNNVLSDETKHRAHANGKTGRHAGARRPDPPAFPARPPLLPALTRSLRAASVFLTTPPHKAERAWSGTLRLYYTSKQTEEETNPETHWGKTRNPPGTPNGPVPCSPPDPHSCLPKKQRQTPPHP